LSDDFERLLRWLDPDRDRAGEKCEELRRKIIKICARRGRTYPEEIADECFDRVIRRLPEIIDTWTGNPALYFFGVLRKLLLEPDAQLDPRPLPLPDPPEVKERNDRCLEECLKKLKAEEREFILEYFKHDRGEKIEHRKQMAARQGITLNTLRMQVHRLKERLTPCVLDCVKQNPL
jgi:DNA-directed RNA polymerase specialized sigma24 family protein